MYLIKRKVLHTGAISSNSQIFTILKSLISFSLNPLRMFLMMHLNHIDCLQGFNSSVENGFLEIRPIKILRMRILKAFQKKREFKLVRSFKLKLKRNSPRSLARALTRNDSLKYCWKSHKRTAQINFI